MPALQVSQMVSRELEKECIVVFDEAHNIDNIAIEALSVNLREHTLEAAARNIGRLNAVHVAHQRSSHFVIEHHCSEACMSLNFLHPADFGKQ